MTIQLKPDSFFVFDLDDTLFQEIDFLHSAYRYIARQLAADAADSLYTEMWHRYQRKENVFEWLLSRFGKMVPNLELTTLLAWYRDHKPELSLAQEVSDFLAVLKQKEIGLGLITDGRSVTQRNKLKALGIEEKFDLIIISEEFGSEKPNPANYEVFIKKFGQRDYWFVGDNTKKDFIIPIRLGWNIICMKDCGKNIHPQILDDLPKTGIVVSSFKDIQLQ